MSTLSPSQFEERLNALQASYQRQMALAGKTGYDPQLTIQLKQDLDWLITEQQKFMLPVGVPRAGFSA